MVSVTYLAIIFIRKIREMYGGPARVDEHVLFSQNTFQKSNEAMHAERGSGSWMEPNRAS